MNRPRTPPAALPDLIGPPVASSPWRWSAAEPEPSGRLLLPAIARRVLGADDAETCVVIGTVRGDTLVLRPKAAGGRTMTIDRRQDSIGGYPWGYCYPTPSGTGDPRRAVR